MPSSVLKALGPSIQDHMAHSLFLSTLQWIMSSWRSGALLFMVVLLTRHLPVDGQPPTCRVMSFTLGSTLLQP